VAPDDIIQADYCVITRLYSEDLSAARFIVTNISAESNLHTKYSMALIIDLKQIKQAHSMIFYLVYLHFLHWYCARIKMELWSCDLCRFYNQAQQAQLNEQRSHIYRFGKQKGSSFLVPGLSSEKRRYNFADSKFLYDCLQTWLATSAFEALVCSSLLLSTPSQIISH